LQNTKKHGNNRLIGAQEKYKNQDERDRLKGNFSRG
jgi:hypothetical protein